MTASIDYLPIWKKDSTAEEWLLELACIARKYPERFEKAVIVLQETLPNGNIKHRTYSRGAKLLEQIGLIECGKMDIFKDSER